MGGWSWDRDGRGLVALGLAAGGVIAGHWLTYLVLQPGAAARAALLGAAGHAYLATAVMVCALSALAAAAATFIARLSGARTELPATRHLTQRLWLLQSLAFCVFEIGERTISGALAELGPALLVGVGAQLLVAWICAWLVHRLLDVADLAIVVWGRPPATFAREGVVVHAPPTTVLAFPGSSVPSTAAKRGPPPGSMS